MKRTAISSATEMMASLASMCTLPGGWTLPLNPDAEITEYTENNSFTAEESKLNFNCR